MKASVEDQLLDMLEDLEKEELKLFHLYLQNGPGGNFTTIKKSLEKAHRRRTVELMVETYTTDHVMEVARLILEKMNKGQSEEKVYSAFISSYTSIFLCQPTHCMSSFIKSNYLHPLFLMLGSSVFIILSLSSARANYL